MLRRAPRSAGSGDADFVVSDLGTSNIPLRWCSCCVEYVKFCSWVMRPLTRMSSSSLPDRNFVEQILPVL